MCGMRAFELPAELPAGRNLRADAVHRGHEPFGDVFNLAAGVQFNQFSGFPVMLHHGSDRSLKNSETNSDRVRFAIFRAKKLLSRAFIERTGFKRRVGGKWQLAFPADLLSGQAGYDLVFGRSQIDHGIEFSPHLRKE